MTDLAKHPDKDGEGCLAVSRGIERSIQCSRYFAHFGPDAHQHLNKPHPTNSESTLLMH